MVQRQAPDGWQQLQEAVAAVLRDAGCDVQVEVTLPTTRSSVNFDVFAKRSDGGHAYSIAVECKHWRKRVPQMVVHAFRTQVQDFGADAGYIVSSAGFQSGAFEAVENTNIRLLTWDEFLNRFEPEGPPLGPGLKGAAQISSGSITFLDQFGRVLPYASSIITGGSLTRDEDGQLVCLVKTEAPMPGLQRANTDIGWEGFVLRGTSSTLSTEATAPTELTGSTEFTTAAGMKGLNPMTGDAMVFPVPIDAHLAIRALGSIQDGHFRGTWSLSARLPSITDQVIPMHGTFVMRLL